jgi:VCBS repeat-containing protein
MADENIIGTIITFQGDGKVLILKASGDTVIAQSGDSIVTGDIVVAAVGVSVVIQIEKNDVLNVSGFVVLGSAAVAIFDDIFFEKNAASIDRSTQENPAQVGFEPSFDIEQLFNAAQVGGTIVATIATADDSSTSARVIEIEIKIDGDIEAALPSPSGGVLGDSFISDPFIAKRSDQEGIPRNGRLQGRSEGTFILDDAENIIPIVPETISLLIPSTNTGATVALVDQSTDIDVTETIVEVLPPLFTINISGNNDSGEGANRILEASSATETGSITVTAINGVQTLTVAGQSVLDVAVLDVFTHVVLVGVYGTLTITSFDVANGIISYSYVEDGTAKVHGSIVDSFAIVLTDSIGNSATSNTSIDFTINDTTPDVSNDTKTITEGATAISVTTVTGNVTGGVGATAGDMVDTLVDSNVNPVIPANVIGSYGSLVLLSDGQYTYTLDNANPVVQGLKAISAPLIETFTYILTDGDGSTNTATLTISVNGEDDASAFTGDDTASLTEDVDTDAITPDVQLTATGALSINDVDTADSPSIVAGAGTFNGPGPGALGSLVIDASGNWTYAVSDTRVSAIQDINTGETITEVYTINATDGASHDITITINGVDDILAVAPIIGDDAVPESTGLLLKFYDGNNGVAPTVALEAAPTHQSPNTEALADVAVPTTIARLTTGIGQRLIEEIAATPTNATDFLDLGRDDVYSLTGLVYLEAGSAYKFDGYRDDSLHIELGGQVMVTTKGNSYGSFGTGVTVTASGNGGAVQESVFIAPADGFYTLEVYFGNWIESGGIFTLALSQDDVSRTLSAKNYQLFTGAEDLINAGAYVTDFVSNTGVSVDASFRNGNSISATTATVNTDGGYFPIVSGEGVVSKTDDVDSVDLSSLSAQIDENDTLKNLIISNIPVGAVLSDGAGNSAPASTSLSDTVDITTWARSGLTIDLSGVIPAYVAGDTVILNIEVTAESSTRDTAVTSGTFTVGIIATSYETDSANSVQVDNDIQGVIDDGNDEVVYGSGGDDTITASNQFGVVIHGRAGNDSIVGGNDNTGNPLENGNNTIFGGAGNDSIVGGSGQDVIFGGRGSDTLRGGFSGMADTDTDRFVWQAADAASDEVDVILDFQTGVGGDVLDVSALLSDELLSSNLANYISLDDSGADTTLTFDVDGDGDVTGYDDLTVTLTGVTGETLASLISSGNIFADDIQQEAYVIRGSTGKDYIVGTAMDETIYSGGLSAGNDHVYGLGGSDTFILDGDTAFLADNAKDHMATIRLRDATVGDVSTDSDADVLNIKDFLDGAGLTATELLPYLHVESWYYGTTLLYIDKEGSFDAAARSAIDANPGGGANGADILVRLTGLDVFAGATSEANNTIAQLQSLMDLGFLVVD